MVNGLHMVIGLAIVVSFLLLTILNYLRMSRGMTFSWAQGLSFTAAGLLLIQYIIGFALLGDDGDITPLHYILAIAAIVPIGAEHMLAGSERSERDKRRLSFFASFAALLLVVIVYSLGDRSG